MSWAVLRARPVWWSTSPRQCGLTPQYDGLQRLYDEYRDRGLEVLGFPCNQFGGQEPGSESEIATFCEKNYGVEFPMFGEGRRERGRVLIRSSRGSTNVDTRPDGAGDIAWNFAKFLIGPDGEVLARFAPTTEPCSAR